MPAIEDVDAAALRFLATAQAHGVAVDAFHVSETHFSWLFFTPDVVLKLKKAMQIGTLDHSTLERRAFDSREEVRLNRRLAPDVYLGLSVLQRGDDGWRLVPEELADPAAATVEWLVRMRRLPQALSLDRLIVEEAVGEADIDAVARLLERFYRDAEAAPLPPAAHVDHFRSQQHLNRVVLTDRRWQPPQAAAVLDRFDACLTAQAPLLGERGSHLVDGHGDLRPEHVFLTEPPVVIDCLEFDARLRLADPYDELAFLGLECRMAGAPWIGARLFRHFSQALGRAPAPETMRIYMVARALTRARLALAHLLDPQPRDPDRWPVVAAGYLESAAALLDQDAALGEWSDLSC